MSKEQTNELPYRYGCVHGTGGGTDRDRETECCNPITQRPKEANRRAYVDLYSKRSVHSMTKGSGSPPLSGRNGSTLSAELKQVLIPRVILVQDFRKVDVPGP